MLKGGHNTFWGSFNTGALSFSHTERWMQKVSTLKKKRGGGRGRKYLPCLEGRGQTVSDLPLSYLETLLP